MTEDQWGPWKPWQPETALYPPYDVQPGAIVEADLVIRANAIGKPFENGEPRPVTTRNIFTVWTGEAWVLYPNWTDICSTHLVTLYRVWGGTCEEYETWLYAEILEDAT